MKLIIIGLFSLLTLLPNNKEDDCLTCISQDKEYFCAANTLSINSRLCIDVTEVPAHVYKDYLASVAMNFGEDSNEFIEAQPNYELWTQLFPEHSADELKTIFISSDELALMPIVGITLTQAKKFAKWRTKAMEEYLSTLNARERSNFPKKFEFRLPTENEWARIRFLIQDKKMLKQLQKIAKTNQSAFKLAKSNILSSQGQIRHVYSIQDEEIGFYNVFGNVAEMTSTEGVAMGGSFSQPNTSKKFTQSFHYKETSTSLGVRMIFEIID